MIGFAPEARTTRRWIFGRGLFLALILTAPARAQQTQAEPLARYVPAEGLAILVEHNGFDAQPDAWKGTAAYKMLTETSLGAMLEEITAQIADRALQARPGAPVSGRELVALLVHLARKGFAVGVLFNPQPPSPRPQWW